MSLQWALSREVPAETAAIGQRVLKADNVYRQIGERFDELFPAESEFAALYDSRGRGALPPLLAALVTVFQMLERVPDRQAAEFVASRLDWKFALHLPLDYPGFHWTDLLAFRNRLWANQQEALLYDRFLSQLQGLGLIRRRGKVRTDSTHVLAVVERLSQLELVHESLRLALRALTEQDRAWVEAQLPASFCETYGQAAHEYGLSQEAVRQRLGQAGQDGFWLLAHLARTAAPALSQLAAVTTLRTVLAQQFPQGASGPPAERRPTGEGVIESPHEPEARYATKRGESWQGYKSQATETCEADRPHLIVDLEPTSALANDAPQLPLIQGRLGERDLLPGEQLVDQGYMSGEHLVRSAEQGICLLGQPLADTQAPPGFRQTDFQIDEQAHQATCPQGQVSQWWHEQRDEQGQLRGIQIRFAAAACQACPCFGRCTRSPRGRSLTLHPYRAALLARRAEAQTAAFQQRLQLRAGIEGTISELVRVYGLRRARYRGLVKQRLQHYFTAVAANLRRLARWWGGAPVAASAGAAR